MLLVSRVFQFDRKEGVTEFYQVACNLPPSALLVGFGIRARPEACSVRQKAAPDLRNV